SWYGIGGITIQPSEFAKAATALAVAKYISDLNTDIKRLKDQLSVLAIVAIPALLVLLQKDAGSTLVYGCFIFILYREGISPAYLLITLTIIILSLLSIKFGVLATSIVIGVIVLTYHFTRRRKPLIVQPIFIILVGCMITFGV